MIPPILRRHHTAQAALELALSVPALLGLLVLIVGAGRMVHAELGVQAVAREAARTCASAPSAGACLEDGLARAQEVAAGYRLDARVAEVRLDAGRFERGGRVVAHAHYPVALLGPGPFGLVITAESAHAEMIERYRSREVDNR